ncbi:hypothetical protein V247_01866, partial [Staphylococcus aureus F63712]
MSSLILISLIYKRMLNPPLIP